MPERVIIFMVVLATLEIALPLHAFTQIDLLPTGGPQGGKVNEIRTQPGGNLYAATAGGVYQSSDQGSHWIRTSGGLKPINVTAIAVQPNGTLLAATSHPFFGGRSVYRSTDNGTTWILVGSGIPDIPGIITTLVSSVSGVVFAGTEEGRLYRSTDNGSSWSMSNQGMNAGQINDIVIDDPDTMYLATATGGAYTSTNGGTVWVPITTGLSSPHLFDLSLDQSRQLFSSGTDGAYRFNAGTQGWEPLPLSLDGIDVVKIESLGNGDIVAIGWSSTTHNVIHHSTDNGMTWTSEAPDIPGRVLGLDRVGDVNFLSTSVDGVYRSSSGGPWQKINTGLIATSVTAVDADGSTIIAACDGGIIHISTDGGLTWVASFHNTVPGEVIRDFSVSPSGGIWAAGGAEQQPKVHYKEPGGGWEDRSTSFQGTGEVYGIGTHNSTILGIGTDGCRASTDGGATFLTITPPLGGEDVAWSAFGDRYEAASYAGIRSSSNAINWGAPRANAIARRIAVNPANGNLYTASAFDHVDLITLQNQVTPLTNGWRANAYPTDVVYTADNRLYATWTQSGFPSKISGISEYDFDEAGWRPESEWTSDAFEVGRISFHSAPQANPSTSPALYVATAGLGVWKADLMTSVDQSSSTPSGFALQQNFPNPFNPTTNLEFQIAGSGPVSLRVYDILGREVATLVNDVRARGSYNVIFDASGLSSGTYFCRLRAGRFSETRKLSLIR